MPAETPQPPVPLAEIAQGPGAFEMFLDRNQKNLVILAILLVLATAAFVVYRGITESTQKSAGIDLSKAEDLPSLQAVVNNHPDTNAALSAKILVADRQWSEGQQDAAIETLRKFIAEGAGHPALPTAQASLASKLMSQGKSPEASKLFQDLVADPNARYVAPYALICLGDIALTAGDTEKAEASYNRVKTDFADSNFVDIATRRVTSLKAKAPAEIAPPPAPEPAPADAAPPGISIAPSPESGITVTPVDPTPGAASAPDATPPADEAPAQSPAPDATTVEPAQESPTENRNEGPATGDSTEPQQPAENP